MESAGRIGDGNPSPGFCLRVYSHGHDPQEVSSTWVRRVEGVDVEVDIVELVHASELRRENASETLWPLRPEEFAIEGGGRRRVALRASGTCPSWRSGRSVAREGLCLVGHALSGPSLDRTSSS